MINVINDKCWCFFISFLKICFFALHDYVMSIFIELFVVLLLYLTDIIAFIVLFQSLIGSYIRLFEPLVVKAMKLYTTTSSLELQRQILDILIQLIQLRVNYCLLDSDLIFLGFVLRQLEYIEEGHMRSVLTCCVMFLQ